MMPCRSLLSIKCLKLSHDCNYECALVNTVIRTRLFGSEHHYCINNNRNEDQYEYMAHFVFILFIRFHISGIIK